MNAHQQEIENLIEHMENDRTRQQENLKRKLQEKRRQRVDGLQRKHEREQGAAGTTKRDKGCARKQCKDIIK